MASITLPDMIKNKQGLYEGDLVHYFKALFAHAKNLTNPYHNFRHMLHVFWRCYGACEYYAEKNPGTLSPRDCRILLIASMFHDFDHIGKAGNDDLNIELACRGLRRHLHPTDHSCEFQILELIRITEFPHKEPGNMLTLSGQILRDADMSQAFSEAWIQQVIFGLSSEWGSSPRKILEMQKGFLENLEFSSDWAREVFPESVIAAKIQQAQDLLECLE